MSTAATVNPAEAAPHQGLSIWAVASFLFMCALAYHYIVWGYNYRYSPAEDNWITAGVMGVVLIPLAFLERPATIMLVNAIRLKDNFLVLIFWFAIVCGLGFMAFNITMSSHETMAEQRNNRVSSHTSQLETVNRVERTAKSTFDAAKSHAKGMTPARAESYLASAQLQYDRTMLKASTMRSQQYNDAPVKQEHSGEFDWLTAAVQSALIGLAFSMGAIIVTIYEQMHIQTTQRIPAFSLASKLGQEWQAYKENFTAGNFDVDPTRGFFNGMFFKVKKQVTSPSEKPVKTLSGPVLAQCHECGDITQWPSVSALENRQSNDGQPLRCDACDELYHPVEITLETALAKKRIQKAQQKNADDSSKKTASGTAQTLINDQVKADALATKTGKVYTRCPSCKALYNPKLGSIQPTQKNPNGLLKCAECTKPFVALDCLVDNETARQFIQENPEGSELSYNGYTLTALKDEGFEHHFNMGTYYYILPNEDGETATCLLPHPDEKSWLYIAQMDGVEPAVLRLNSSETGGPFQDFHWAINEYREIESKAKEKGPGGPYFEFESFYDYQSRGVTTTVDEVPVLSSRGYVLIPHPTKPAWIFSEQFQTEHPLKWLLENPATPNAVKFKNTIAQYKQLANGDAEAKPAANSDESRAPSEFAVSSQRVREDKQEVTGAGNSLGTRHELAGNSSRTRRELRGGASSRVREPSKAAKTRQVDLSEIMKTDDKQAKLKELANTIDRLSSDPEYDGVFFSPKYTAKELHINYDPVKAVFDQKKLEGKISTDRRCKIIYKAPKE